jgi:3'(2'), 5'-bisphosphate nucleotidase
VVWVDPLDGTREYTEGFVEHVTVLIGISYRSRPVGGVINQPFYGPNGRTIWGVPGLGVKGMTCTSAGSPSDKLDRPLNIAVTRSHMNQLLQETMDAIKPAEILRVGGSGHKILLVLEGKADAYVYTCLGTKRWDTCAGEAIVLAAGGKLTDSLGELISYDPHAKDMMNYKGVVVTMRCHDDLISMIPEKVKTKL